MTDASAKLEELFTKYRSYTRMRAFNEAYTVCIIGGVHGDCSPDNPYPTDKTSSKAWEAGKECGLQWLKTDEAMAEKGYWLSNQSDIDRQ